jgi:hypothetical protein
MDSLAHTAPERSLPRFVLRWLLCWILPAMLATCLVGTLGNLRLGGAWGGLVHFGLLLFPALWALSHAYVMREHLRRPILWGVLTGGGAVAGVAVVVAVHVRFEAAWWPLRDGIVLSFLRAIGLVDPSEELTDIAVSGAIFGLVLGAIQTSALDMSRASRLQWTAVSAATGLLTAGSLYLSFELPEMAGPRDALADLMPLNGRWRFLPGATLWAAAITLCFALPTGIFMHRLLRWNRRADAEALVRRFE